MQINEWKLTIKTPRDDFDVKLVLIADRKVVSCKYVCNALCCQSTAAFNGWKRYLRSEREKYRRVHKRAVYEQPTQVQCSKWEVSLFAQSTFRIFIAAVCHWILLKCCSILWTKKTALDDILRWALYSTDSHRRGKKKNYTKTLQLQLIIFFASSLCNVSWSLGSEIQFL